MPTPTVTSVAARLRAAGCVFAEDEAAIILATATEPDAVDTLIARRARGLPLEQVVGWARFRGRRVLLDPGVFVPRRRSEFLAGQAARSAAARGPGAVVLDLCCGSGALGAAVAAEVPGVELHAADVEEPAVRCARRNLAGTAGAVVHHGDLYAALPDALRGRVDVLVANAPYVPSGEIGLLPAEAREHEPRVTLDGGADGLDVQRRVIVGAPGWLADGGRLLVETSERQAAATAEAFRSAGLAPRTLHREGLGATVVLGGRARSARARSARA